MRTDPRFTRVKALITSADIPRDRGILQLCHSCQRRVHFVGGFLKLLAKILDSAATCRGPQGVIAKQWWMP